MTHDIGGDDSSDPISNQEAWEYFLDGPRELFTCESCGSEAHRGNPTDMIGALYSEVDNEPTIVCVSCNEKYDRGTLESRIRRNRRGASGKPLSGISDQISSIVRPITSRIPIPLSVYDVGAEKRATLFTEHSVFIGRLAAVFAFLFASLGGLAAFATFAGAIIISPDRGLDWLSYILGTYRDWGQAIAIRPSLAVVGIGIAYLVHQFDYQRHVRDVDVPTGRSRPRWHYLTVCAAGGLIGWVGWMLGQQGVLNSGLVPFGVLTWTACTLLLIHFLHVTLLEDRWGYGLRPFAALWKFPVQFSVGVLLFGRLIGLSSQQGTIAALALITPVVGLLYAIRRGVAFTELGDQWSRWFRQITAPLSAFLPSPWRILGTQPSSVGELNQFGTLPEDLETNTGISDIRGTHGVDEELRQTREWASYLESELRDREERMEDLEARLAQVREELQDARQTDATDASTIGDRADLLLDLFDIRDNFRRALEAEIFLEDEATEEFRDSLELIDRQIESTLEREGIEEIDVTGQVNPSKHHVIETVSVADSQPGEILDVHRIGYRQGDRILREAQVVVAEDPHTETGEPDTRSGNGGDLE